MDRARHLRNYDMHSWVGIVLGLIVYIVCFTGSFALFYGEVRSWEDPSLRISVPEELPEMDGIFNQWVEDTSEGNEVTFRRFEYPTEHHPYFGGGMTVQWPQLNEDGTPKLDDSGEVVTRGEFVDAHWHPSTGEPLAQRGTGFSRWMLDFHRDLMWPDGLGGRTVGRSLVGIVGIILMLAILSGIIAHTKIREEAYSMRLKRSQRLKWQDTHKVVGIWGLPFFIMIAFTGAFLGVIVIVSQLIAATAFKGDVDSLVAAVLGPETEPTGEQVQMLSLEEIRAIRHPESGEQPYLVVMNNYGDAAAEFNLFYESKAELSFSELLYINGATGTFITDDPWNEVTAANRVTNAMAPLHYGTYGGIWLKFLYFALGIGLSVITALGSMMWIERRKHGNEGGKSEAFYNRLGNINAGVFLGLPVATIAIFYLDKVYMGAESARMIATGWTYFAVWGLGLVYAVVRQNDYASTRELVALTGLLALGIPVLNGIATGDWFWSALASDHTMSAWVDVVMLISGAFTVFIAYHLPKARKEKQRSKRAVTDPSVPVPAE